MTFTTTTQSLSQGVTTTRQLDNIDLAIMGRAAEITSVAKVVKAQRTSKAPTPPLETPAQNRTAVIADPRAILARQGKLKIEGKSIKEKMNEQAGKNWRREHQMDYFNKTGSK